MKNIHLISILIPVVLLLAACGPTVTEEPPSFQGMNPYEPQPGDRDMQRDDITIDSSMLALTRSLPPQGMLRFTYFPPTACHQLRVEVSGPDSQNNINVSAYSVVEKDKPCTAITIVTPLVASLNLGSFPSGHYIVLLNEAIVDEFDT